MYESPITTMITEVQDNIAKQFAEQTENMVYEEIRQVGIHVDKDELLKALQYDRNQYSKGYADGKAEMRKKIDRAIEEIQRIHDDTQQKVDYAYERDGVINEKADLACFIYRDCLRILKSI